MENDEVERIVKEILDYKIKLPRANYYQGVLQLRNITPEILHFVKNQITKRNDVCATKIVKLSDGIDIFLSSQKFITMIAKKLKESFGGQMKIASKLHTKSKQGKDLFRVNAFFRLANYKKGDIITVRGEEVRLLSIGGKIFAKNMKTGRKVTLRLDDMPQD
ncbi:MAG TPA: NMD3-related protein [Candidatus Nanoarchaeia archaeon]|nr:NMD3-related protein [Candidatus Nanoarchaeia archaeon]